MQLKFNCLLKHNSSSTNNSSSSLLPSQLPFITPFLHNKTRNNNQIQNLRTLPRNHQTPQLMFLIFQKPSMKSRQKCPRSLLHKRRLTIPMEFSPVLLKERFAVEER